MDLITITRWPVTSHPWIICFTIWDATCSLKNIRSLLHLYDKFNGSLKMSACNFSCTFLIYSLLNHVLLYRNNINKKKIFLLKMPLVTNI